MFNSSQVSHRTQTETTSAVAHSECLAFYARTVVTMASFTMNNEILAAREGVRGTSETENATPVLAPREGERADQASMPPPTVEQTRERGWQAAWDKAITFFQRILPQGLQTARGMQATGDIDDNRMCALGVNIFTQAQEAGALKWPLLQTYLQFVV